MNAQISITTYHTIQQDQKIEILSSLDSVLLSNEDLKDLAVSASETSAISFMEQPLPITIPAHRTSNRSSRPSTSTFFKAL